MYICAIDSLLSPALKAKGKIDREERSESIYRRRCYFARIAEIKDVIYRR